MHLAAESHVDRSIDGPKDFIYTNIFGTFNMLQKARKYWLSLTPQKQECFRFHHISTDEVYGSLENGLFDENSKYRPNSPYSASKASADHLVRAWNKTFKIPTLLTNCSNNYGPYQFPEKFIPLMILNALEFKALPVYGDGKYVRDWLYVDDHVRALLLVVEKGRIGHTYNIGANCEKQNIEVVQMICDILDNICPNPSKGSRRQLITFVQDRPAHDRRYAIDTTKIAQELGFHPQETFESGLEKTIKWYINNTTWVERVCSGKYRRQRLGVLT